MRSVQGLVTAGVAMLPWSSAQAQDQLNRADPSIIERALPGPAVQPKAPPPPPSETAKVAIAEQRAAPRVANAIIVEGGAEIPRAAFSAALVPYIGRDLSSDDLSALSRAVADVARGEGFPFASAWIEPQAMAGAVLRVRLDAGTLSAVRVVGAINTMADRLLSRALVTGRPVRRAELERAILLVGDLPGIAVKESKYVRQDGFGILLVTITQDRASAYAQIDNRGSKEVGPIRSTLLGSLNGLLQSGDELNLIVAQTPFRPNEFVFARARYTMPVDADGATVSASGSYGRANPGGLLDPLDVIGESSDQIIGYSKPLLRSRSQSLWGVIELRNLHSSLSLLGSPLRNDRLTTLTAAVRGVVKTGPGSIRAEVAITDGLPLPGVSHQGDARISRSDGDARFVTGSFDVEWTTPLIGRFSVALASEGQIASRPLLATAEIGVGGPVFGRGYDYAERTGDDGILGSGELRLDIGQLVPGLIERVQLYGSVDGGYVGNLRGGGGGGSLLSTAAGVRMGHGRLGGMVEVALPLNEDRFDTGNRDPRISFRVSRVF